MRGSDTDRVTHTALRLPTRALVAVVGAWMAVAACTERSPSGPDDSRLPAEPVTVTLQIPWDQFASNLRVFGGYGAPAQMGSSILARSFGGMEARTLVEFAPFPTSIQFPDSVGTLRTDTAFTIIDAYIVMRFDPIASTNTDTVTLALSATSEAWDPGSATWLNASNRIGDVRPWSQPGGGAVQPIATRVWDRAASGDSAFLFLDSATIASWRKPDSIRAARIDLLTDGERLEMTGITLRFVASSEINPDSIRELLVPSTAGTFIFDPPAAPPLDGMRVGGVPAWRTVLDVSLASTVTSPPELCDAVGCPFTLSPQNVTYAALTLRSRATEDAFRPRDSLAFEVRAVLSPVTLPKSPLSSSFTRQGGKRVAPDLFGTALEGSLVEIPITLFLQTLLAGPDAAGRPPSSTLAILPAPEPADFTYASFFGPGGATAPVLTLILTASSPMELP